MQINGTETLLTLPKSKMARDRLFFVLKIIFTILALAVLFVGSWALFTIKWGSETWSDLKLNEMIYTLMMPLDGTNSGMITDHIRSCVMPAAIITLAALVFLIIIRHRRTAYTITQIAAAMAGVILAAKGSTYAWEVLDLSTYLENQETYSSFIDENYIDPANVPLEFPEEKRNLIYIYLESAEATFADQESGGAFEKNVIPELTQIALENETFAGAGSTVINGGHAMTGATWTIAAMFAQTTGLPLTIPIDSNSMALQNEFFPGVTALGDILKNEGYKQVFLLGSDVTFGGRQLYFSQHGDYELRDYYYYVNNGTIPPDYFVWWGYEDKYLFENAKSTLAELSKGKEPFNLTMLTVDTHFEDGYVCDLCGNEFDDQYSNVYACSSRQVAEFLKWLEKQPYYDDTTVIIAGDHKTMDKDFCAGVPAEYDRKTYFTIINSPEKPENDIERQYSTFDIFPTTIAALGVDIPGDRLGLGVNLYSAEKTMYEIYGEKLFNEGLASRSDLMEKLTAGIDKDYAGLEIGKYDEATHSVEVDAFGVSLPANSNGLLLYVWPAGNEEVKKAYAMKAEDEDSFSFVIPLDDFGNMNGTYNIHLYSNGVARDTFLAATKMVIDDPNAEEGIYQVEAETTVQISPYDYSTGFFAIELLNVPKDTVQLSVAVWVKSDQSDLKWYDGTPDEFGVYTIYIPASEFGTLVVDYNIHCYAANVNGETKMLAAVSTPVG